MSEKAGHVFAKLNTHIRSESKHDMAAEQQQQWICCSTEPHPQTAQTLTCSRWHSVHAAAVDGRFSHKIERILSPSARSHKTITQKFSHN